MSETQTRQPIHPEELLPWLVNGTLSAEERQEVQEHVASCSHCQQEIALLERMRRQVKGTPTQSPGEIGLARLLKEVRQEQAVTMVQPQTQSWGWRTGLALAASLIIFIQAGFLIDAWFLSKPMAPLAGPQVPGTILQISFQPAATEAQIREAIIHVHGTFIDGPSSLGLYRIRLEVSGKKQPTLDKAINHLRQQTTIIQHVAQE